MPGRRSPLRRGQSLSHLAPVQAELVPHLKVRFRALSPSLAATAYSVQINRPSQVGGRSQ